MVESKASAEHLFEAIRNNDIQDVERLLQKGADVSQRNHQCLQIAAEYGYTKIAEMLIKYGAKPSADNHYALQLASNHGHLEFVELLLKHKPDVHADDDQALRWATVENRTAVMRLLIDHGANPFANDGEIIKLCIDLHKIKMLEVLLEKEPPKEWGERILEWAEKTENHAVIKLVQSSVHRKRLEEKFSEDLKKAKQPKKLNVL